MSKVFNIILDECIDRINRGEKLEDCLARYPEHAEELELLLRAMLDAQTAYTFTPSPTTKMVTRQRFNTALEEIVRRREERRQPLPRVLGWSKAWVPVAAVLVVALISYFGLRPVLFPVETGPQLPVEPGPQLPVEPGLQPGPLPVMPSPQPSQEGNFAFLISDDVNAINDFQSLNISISKIGLQQEDKADQWIELDPEVELVDLTLLQEDKAKEIWRGNVPEGKYTTVFIHVSDVNGVLKETGKSGSVKLPSNKLRISKPFKVTGDSVVNFVYDVTVVEAGKSGKYILKPQVGQSGADQRFEKIE
jgi:hypothetical protein